MGLKQNCFISLLACAGMWGVTAPVSAQALLPHTLEPDFEHLEQQGIKLAQDAQQLAQFQQFEAALARAKVATQLAPESYEPWLILGRLQARDGNNQQAIVALQKASEIAPDEPDIFFNLGSVYFEQGNYQQSINALQKGLEIESDSHQALFNLGNAHLQLKQYDDAIASYEKAFNLEQQFWPAINNIGLVKYEQGKVSEAIEDWETAAEIAEQPSEPQLAIAVALYQQGQSEQARSLAEKALQSNRRYGSLDFLEENLWGEALLKDTAEFLNSSMMEGTLSRLQITPPHQKKQQ